MRRVNAWLDRLVQAGLRPEDSQEDALRKAILTIVTISIVVSAFVWVLMYAALGLYLAAAIPLIYQVLSIAGLLIFFRTKDFRLFGFRQLALMIALPFLLQWTLGGFLKSGAVMVWAFTSPIGGLLFQGPREGAMWFGAFLALTVVSGLLDGVVAAATVPIPSWLSVGFFVMNIGVVSTVTYIVLQYFARERARGLAALHEQHQILQDEQHRSESLLLNILPKPIAERLKRQPEAIAEGFSEATVLFADIVDFTRTTAGLAPERTVAWLNELFSRIDDLSERHGLEKIKTIGDAYMAVSGIPTPRADHAEAVANMALDLQEMISGLVTPSGEPVRMRIGIHTGPVVAGVIGTKKFIYDLWGDTVNTASRMESHGVAGTIQATDAAYERLKHRYAFEERGMIEVKGKGQMRTWLMTGRRPTPEPAGAARGPAPRAAS
jgi:class 3 adenylate cyclase